MDVRVEHTDGDLVQAARRGDADAFHGLVMRYQRPAYLVALGVTGSHEDAEDVAQDAFVTALRRLDECRDPERFGGWFMTIVRNQARNSRRREARRTVEVLPESAEAGGAGPAGDAELAELRRQLEGALAELPEVRREVILLHDVEGWKHHEIAQRLGLPAGTVRSHVHFARKALRQRLLSRGNVAAGRGDTDGERRP